MTGPGDIATRAALPPRPRQAPRFLAQAIATTPGASVTCAAP